MSVKISKLSEYAKVAALWSIDSVKKIEKNGSAMGENNKIYNSVDDYKTDTRKQLISVMAQCGLEGDISIDDAMKILFPVMKAKENKHV